MAKDFFMVAYATFLFLSHDRKQTLYTSAAAYVMTGTRQRFFRRPFPGERRNDTRHFHHVRTIFLCAVYCDRLNSSCVYFSYSQGNKMCLYSNRTRRKCTNIESMNVSVVKDDGRGKYYFKVIPKLSAFCSFHFASQPRFGSRSWPQGGYSFGNGRHFHFQNFLS
jgi:hypothetical protein